MGFTVSPGGQGTNLEAADALSQRNPAFLLTLVWSGLNVPCVAGLQHQLERKGLAGRGKPASVLLLVKQPNMFSPS